MRTYGLLESRAGTESRYLIWYAKYLQGEFFRVYVVLPRGLVGDGPQAIAWAKALREALGPVASFRSDLGRVPAFAAFR